jgi:hypothetical protein
MNRIGIGFRLQFTVIVFEFAFQHPRAEAVKASVRGYR